MSKKKKYSKLDSKQLITTLILAILFLAITYSSNQIGFQGNPNTTSTLTTYFNINDIPDYTTEVCVPINNNQPFFSEEDYTTQSFEKYSDLDSLGRCGIAFANISKETMPPFGDERGDISSVRPTGWKQNKINGEYLYNRCHLIAYCLSDEDDNELNLITGTRYFNVEGMLPFEKKVAQYIDNNPGNHVLYRVTPIFKDNNLLASGVEIEAWSVEDSGKGICFNVYCYNVQPGVYINYETGESHAIK